MEKLGIKLGFDNYFCVDSRWRSRGLALLWNTSIEVEFLTYTNWHISAMLKLTSKNFKWQMTSFCGHPMMAKRHESWNLQKALKPDDNIPWLCFGDLNEISHQREKSGPLLDLTNRWSSSRKHRLSVVYMILDSKMTDSLGPIIGKGTNSLKKD